MSTQLEGIAGPRRRTALSGNAGVLTAGVIVSGALLGLGLSCILLAAAGYRVGPALSALAEGAFGGKQECIDTLTAATPLFMTALATVVAYRARIWTVGQDGQLVLGAIFGYAATVFCNPLPQPLSWMVPLLAGALGGALWSVPPALARTRWNVNEIVSTVMLNYISVFLLMYLLGHFWADAGTTYVQSGQIGDRTHLPALGADGTLNLQVAIAPAVALAIAVMLRKSTFGFELLSFGHNPRTSSFKGISSAATCFKVFAISGAISGLCGAAQILGTDWRLSLTVASGVGYAGIMVAMLGRLNPAGALVAALFFGALDIGSASMQLEAGVPSTVARAMQAILLISFLLVGALSENYLAKRGSDA